MEYSMGTTVMRLQSLFACVNANALHKKTVISKSPMYEMVIMVKKTEFLDLR